MTTKTTTFMYGSHKQHITHRLNYSMSSEVTIEAGETARFLEFPHQIDKPFDIMHVTVKLTALADGAVCDLQPSVLDRFVKIGIDDRGKNECIASVQRRDASRACGLPLQRVDETSFRWLPTEPLMMYRGDELQVVVVPRESFAIAIDGEKRVIDQIRVEVTIEGDNCIGVPAALAPRPNGANVGVENPLG